MKNDIIIKGKENDITYRFSREDIFIEELYVKIKDEQEWIKIGFKDLKKAIGRAESRFNPKGLRICPNCHRKHNETAYNAFCCDACWNGY